MHDNILITSGFGVAIGIAVIAILVNREKDIFTALKISIILFAIDWIILSAFFCLTDDSPTYYVDIIGTKTEIIGIIIWTILFFGQFFLLIGFYASSVALGKKRISDAGSENVRNGTGAIA